MTDCWQDTDDPRVRAAFGYLLRAHVAYQSGEGTDAPSLLFAGADYEVGDGTCGLHEDGKQANEPAIVYVRADAYLDALAEIERLKEKPTRYIDRVERRFYDGVPVWVAVLDDGSELGGVTAISPEPPMRNVMQTVNVAILKGESR